MRGKLPEESKLVRSRQGDPVGGLPCITGSTGVPNKFNAGRRTDFCGKNRAIFSGEFFSGEGFLPENSFLGQKMLLDFK